MAWRHPLPRGKPAPSPWCCLPPLQVPFGCSRFTVKLKRPLGIVLEQDSKNGNIYVVRGVCPLLGGCGMGCRTGDGGRMHMHYVHAVSASSCHGMGGYCSCGRRDGLGRTSMPTCPACAAAAACTAAACILLLWGWPLLASLLP